MSAYRPDSEVSILNEKRFYNNLSADTKEVIEKALFYWRLSNGAFDITVQPVLKELEKLRSQRKYSCGR
jgi:thiamine biosynthesis lipoprotein ApbE